jgi:hypothetical protein
MKRFFSIVINLSNAITFLLKHLPTSEWKVGGKLVKKNSFSFDVLSISPTFLLRS